LGQAKGEEEEWAARKKMKIIQREQYSVLNNN
jgi:hypothetical protein